MVSNKLLFLTGMRKLTTPYYDGYNFAKIGFDVKKLEQFTKYIQ